MRFRKSIKFGPFRINVSNTGVGWSVGTRGFRTGVSAKGRPYTTTSIPGTGLSHTTTSPRASGCATTAIMLCAVGLSIICLATYFV